MKNSFTFWNKNLQIRNFIKKVFFLFQSKIRKIMKRKNDKKIILVCPCAKRLFKIKNLKEGYKFFCTCGEELVIHKLGKEWILEPTDGVWKMDTT